MTAAFVPARKRDALLACTAAGCFHCIASFAPAEIRTWRAEAALCPECGVEAVVGFDGPADIAWLLQEQRLSF